VPNKYGRRNLVFHSLIVSRCLYLHFCSEDWGRKSLRHVVNRLRNDTVP
jgi:hypothetical protein